MAALFAYASTAQSASILVGPKGSHRRSIVAPSEETFAGHSAISQRDSEYPFDFTCVICRVSVHVAKVRRDHAEFHPDNDEGMTSG